MIYIKKKYSKRAIIIFASLSAILVIVVSVVAINYFADDNKNMNIIVINKCEYVVSDFWEVAYEGMKEAAIDNGVEFEYMSPLFEHHVEEQKQVILEAIEKNPDIIILVASDYYEIAPYAIMIAEKGIPLILLDSDVDVSSEYKRLFIGTNSVKAGNFLGETALERTEGDNKNAIILSHSRGAQTAVDREEGIRQGYGDENIVGTYWCQSDENVAYDIIMEVLVADKSIVNILCTNENVTIGAARAVSDLGLEDVIDIYGFDGSKQHVQYLERGIINATVIQSPYQMGYLSIETAVALLNNEDVEGIIETDYLLIDADNMYDEGFREILFPFIK